MNYKRQYDLLMEKARVREKVNGYKERHHVIPKSMGGSNKKENIVELTAREHFVAHRLLYMHYRTKEMAWAWHRMTSVTGKQQRVVSAKDYERVREAVSVSSKGKTFSDSHMQALRKSRQSPEYREKMSKLAKSYTHDRRKHITPEFSRSLGNKIREQRRTRSKDKDTAHRQNLSDALKEYHKVNKVYCEQCGIYTSKSALTRFHHHTSAR